MAKRTTNLPAELPPPPFIDPQLPTKVDYPPRGEGWLHELKVDGYRSLVSIANGKAEIFTRNGLDWTPQYPTIAESVAGLQIQNAVLDGEIYVPDENSKPSFAAMQQAVAKHEDHRMIFYAFDLPFLNGQDLRDRPLGFRKEELRKIIPENHPHIVYAEHIGPEILAPYENKKLLEHAFKIGAEGYVSKRAESRYQGGHHTTWVKSKFMPEEEFVIAGYTGARELESLVVGYYEDGQLKIAGHVHNGLAKQYTSGLHEFLSASVTDHPPGEDLGRSYAKTIWVVPKLIAQVRFPNRTPQGRINRAYYLGQRHDIEPKDVHTPFDDPIPDLAPKPKGPTAPPKTAKRARRRTPGTAPA